MAGPAKKPAAGKSKKTAAPAKAAATSKPAAPAPRKTQAMTPLDEMEMMMDRMVDRMFPRGFLRNWRHMVDWPELPELHAPKMDVIDRDTEILLRAEIPGVDKDHLDVTVTDDSVTVRGSYQHEHKDEQGTFYRREVSRGEFSRTMPLPATVDGSKAKATFNNGVLELSLPKLTQAKRHNIRID